MDPVKVGALLDVAYACEQTTRITVTIGDGRDGRDGPGPPPRRPPHPACTPHVHSGG